MAKKKKGGGLGLYNAGRVLTPRALKKASKALTQLEIRPQASAHRRLAEQLGRERDFQDTGLANLGHRTTATVSEGYKNLAKTAAEGIARQNAIGDLMRSRAGGISSAATAEQTGAATGLLGSQLESLRLRGSAPGGSAQAELARQADAERGRQAASNAAAEQFINASAGGYSQYASGQAQAAQQRGAESISSIQRDMASRRAQSRFGYNQDIRDELGKLADVKALKGATRIKNILELRKGERDYGLGKAAVGVDRGQLAEDIRHNKAGEAIDRQKAASDGSSGGDGGALFDSKADKRKTQLAIRNAILQNIQEHGGEFPAGRREKANLFKEVIGGESVGPEHRQMVKRIYRKLKRKRT